MPTAGGSEHAAEPTASVNDGQALQGVSAIIAPATLLTGIAFYFGWQRVRAFDEYSGLNPGAVGYSTRGALGHAYLNDAQRTGQPQAAVDASSVFRPSFSG